MSAWLWSLLVPISPISDSFILSVIAVYPVKPRHQTIWIVNLTSWFSYFCCLDCKLLERHSDQIQFGHSEWSNENSETCIILFERTFVIPLGLSEYPPNGRCLIKYLLNRMDMVKQCILFLDGHERDQTYADYLEAKNILFPWGFH